jgi:predicted RNA binding protein YcfA (HicA-like mRNA interferase family)
VPKIPPHSGKESIAAFKRAGFVVARTKGDHVSLEKPGIVRPVIVQDTSEDLPEFIVSNNIRTAGISKAYYLSLLGYGKKSKGKKKRKKKANPDQQ